MLTTITPYWGRPDMLVTFLDALAFAHNPQVHHLLLAIDEEPPCARAGNIRFLRCQGPKGLKRSIGQWHNLGARLCNTPWIMKLDLDALPNECYFDTLLPILARAGAREWFNGGMFYINQRSSERHLRGHPLSVDAYVKLTASAWEEHTAQPNYRYPAATNWISRKDHYLRLGGCDERFAGWGWEDYQQIYMLERFQLQRDPLVGQLDPGNVVARCREISRYKARELWEKDHFLGLCHCWHPPSQDRNYRSAEIADANRHVLYDYISKVRMRTNGLLTV